jgi:hypothetical protein
VGRFVTGSLEPPEYASLAGAILVVVAAVLPWAVTAEGTTAGLESNGFLAVLVAFAVLATVAVMQGNRTSSRAALGGGLLIGLIALHWFMTLPDLSTAGAGVYLALLGGVLAAVGGGLRLRRGVSS